MTMQKNFDIPVQSKYMLIIKEGGGHYHICEVKLRNMIEWNMYEGCLKYARQQSTDQ